MSQSRKTAVIYARVSTSKQAEEDLPIAGQLDQCQAKGLALGAEVLRTFVDEGISGRGDNRPQFQAAIAYCELYSPTYFITWSTSRFARNKLDAALYKNRLAHAGTEMVYCSVQIDRSSDGGWITEGILELFDEFYSRQVAADTRRSMLKNCRDGHWNGGRPPYGYRPVPDEQNPKRKRLEPHPAEALIVREVFRLRREGQGAKSIAVHLAARGHTNRGLPWSKKSVTALLRNPCMIGQITFGRRDNILRRALPRDQWIIVQAHEPIIDPGTWAAVQALMDDDANPQESGSPRSTFLFTGLLKCGDCGAGLKIETATGRSARYEYYNCQTAQQGRGCSNRRLPARDLDDWLVAIVAGHIFTRENLESVIQDLNELCGSWARETRERRRVIASQLQDLEGRNKKIYELFETFGRDTPNLGDVTRRLRENNAQIKTLEADLERIDREQAPAVDIADDQIQELAEFLSNTLRNPDKPAKIRSFLREFIKEIKVEGNTAEIIYDPALLLDGSHKPVHSRGIWLPEHPLLRTRRLSINLPEKFRRVA
jgi:site-specific DNA recombinase